MNRLLVAALSGLALSSNAEFWDGNKLLARLNGSPHEVGSAYGYIAGVSDATVGFEFCPPDNVTLGQIADMAKQVLALLPEKRHQPADVFIRAATTNAWPCKKKEQKNDRANSNI